MNDNPKTAPALVLLCAVVLSGAIAGRQSASAEDLHTAKISIADLDLSTAEGLIAARARVLDAARRLCTQVEDLDDLSRHENYLACVEQSVTAALHQIGAPTLARFAVQGGSSTR